MSNDEELELQALLDGETEHPMRKLREDLRTQVERDEANGEVSTTTRGLVNAEDMGSLEFSHQTREFMQGVFFASMNPGAQYSIEVQSNLRYCCAVMVELQTHQSMIAPVATDDPKEGLHEVFAVYMHPGTGELQCTYVARTDEGVVHFIPGVGVQTRVDGEDVEILGPICVTWDED